MIAAGTKSKLNTKKILKTKKIGRGINFLLP
jgi:hypothetical protein